MKHKKLQKKGHNDSDDITELNEDSDSGTYEDQSAPRDDQQTTCNSSVKFSGYDVESLVKGQSSFTSGCSNYHSNSDEDNEEIDVVEPDRENS